MNNGYVSVFEFSNSKFCLLNSSQLRLNNKENIKIIKNISSLKNINLIKSCKICKTVDTPQWRCGFDGKRNLCNACGLRYKRIIKKEKTNKNKNSESSRITIESLLN
eukprot:TRINITY_DN1227_c0_g2_i1.p1 TRINITY_DN1227_c0_g2~~TRINITY_DN1227_c0_g2_i1.p1  ORF type:complete len:107 (+),score=17.92 TRINITY_DN1227_c0_g2_i1:63-383(+)